LNRATLVLAVVCLSVLSMRAQSPAPQAPPPREPQWAFPAINRQLPAEPAEPKRLAGSSKSYTPAEIDNLLAPPDWYPDEHRPAPAIVQKGHGGALACGSCHLMNGEGHPESAGLSGFTADYIAQQMADFKSGLRKDSARMNAIARDVSEQEAREAAEWFASLKPRQWTAVKEAAMVPNTIVGGGRMPLPRPAAAWSRSATASSPFRMIRIGRAAAIRIRDSPRTYRREPSPGDARSPRPAATARRSPAPPVMATRFTVSATSHASRGCTRSTSRGSCTCSRTGAATAWTAS